VLHLIIDPSPTVVAQFIGLPCLINQATTFSGRSEHLLRQSVGRVSKPALARSRTFENTLFSFLVVLTAISLSFLPKPVPDLIREAGIQVPHASAEI
jgi:hypothetical protein